MDYLSDVELVRAAQRETATHRALTILLERHHSMVRRIAGSYFAAGAEPDDLRQHGLLGLRDAVAKYNTASGVPFTAFASLVVTRHVQSAVAAANRERHRPMREFVGFSLPDNGYQGGSHDGNSGTLGDRIPAGETADPAREVMTHHDLRALCAFLDDGLNDTEATVLELFLQGRGYEEIAMRLRCTEKRVDNAMQRVRRKVTDFKGWQAQPGW